MSALAYPVPIWLPRRRGIVSPGEWLREKLEEQRREREATITLAAVTVGINDQQTTTAADWGNSASFTPAAGDLLVAVLAGNSTISVLNDSQNLGWTQVVSETSTSRRLYILIANTVTAASAMTVNAVWAAACTGLCGVARVSGMSRTGLDAVRLTGSGRQVGTNTGAAAGTPACSMPVAALTANAGICGMVNGTNPATVTPPTGWTEQADVGGGATVVGTEWASRNSGWTLNSATWGSTSASVWSAVCVELDTTVPPRRPTPRVVLQAVQRVLR